MALPQRHRLRGPKVFERLYRRARRYDSPSLVLRVMPADPNLPPRGSRPDPPGSWRCGVVISAKVSKSAVCRNRLRRRLHAHLLSLPLRPAAPTWMLISLRPGIPQQDPHRLLGECTHVLRQAGLLP
jgi:ribonuclease P protein component